MNDKKSLDERIAIYLRDCSPHIKQRVTAQLLQEALELIRQQKEELEIWEDLSAITGVMYSKLTRLEALEVE